jgi:hypothetical protein
LSGEEWKRTPYYAKILSKINSLDVLEAGESHYYYEYYKQNSFSRSKLRGAPKVAPTSHAIGRSTNQMLSALGLPFTEDDRSRFKVRLKNVGLLPALG